MTGITKRGKKFYFRKIIDGTRREIPLDTENKKEAETKAARFIATVASDGYDSALDELAGKAFMRKNGDPTFEEMKALYLEFLQQSAKSVRPITQKVNLRALERCMKACGPTVSHLNSAKLHKALLPANPTPANKRTFGGVIRMAQSIFKKNALNYYKRKGLKITNPFKEFEIQLVKIFPYSPLAQDLRETIYTSCETELRAGDAMIVLLAIGAGFRRSEIEAARFRWFSVQSDMVSVSVQEEVGYVPKTGEKRILPISLELWERLLALRGKSDSEYLIPRDKGGKGLWNGFVRVVAWLKTKGVTDKKPIHSLRKEAGSLITKKHGILEASRFLGHSEITTTARFYSGVELVNPVEVMTTKKEFSVDELEAMLKAAKEKATEV